MSVKYADIIIDISHEAIDRAFRYIIPEKLAADIGIGSVVRVPFGRGNKERNGYVINITDQSDFPVDRLKYISSVVSQSVPVEGKLINLAAYIKDTYGSTMINALKTVMPIRPKVRQNVEKWIYTKLDEDAVYEYIEAYEKKHNTAKVRLLKALVHEEPLSMKKISGELNISAQTVNSLVRDGIVEVSEKVIFRSGEQIEAAAVPDIILNQEQNGAVNRICGDMDAGITGKYLLYGITGSGKTEIYVRAIKKAAKERKQSILLIPEIALTFQIVRYLRAYFGNRVAVINSRLSDGERYDIFKKARNGELDVVVGPRSALFVPFPSLGLIIVDEEHESSYISESSPRYHAVDVARKRCDIENASLILGSATPSLESYTKAVAGEYVLLKLTQRAGSGKLPETTIVDLREEMKLGNRSIFSYELMEAIKDRLEHKKQIMLFINKRGYNSFVSCRSCGEALKCPHCDVALKKHKDDSLRCHYCGYSQPVPKKCPSCGSSLIGGYGTGTEKVEAEIKKLFPEAVTLRMDSDTTKGKSDYIDILESFARHEADILIGTQMIVKGHDFPEVTLVGIMLADLTLFNNDYRAGERTFALLTQASGRAGRGVNPGKVIIQTYQPDNYVIKAAKEQDYEAFYKMEMSYRRLMKYPPAWDMMVMLIVSENRELLEKGCNILRSRLKAVNSLSNMKIIGPVEPVISKINDKYRRVVYFKSSAHSQLVELMNQIEDFMENDESCRELMIQFDFNPVKMY